MKVRSLIAAMAAMAATVSGWSSRASSDEISSASRPSGEEGWRIENDMPLRLANFAPGDDRPDRDDLVAAVAEPSSCKAGRGYPRPAWAAG